VYFSVGIDYVTKEQAVYYWDARAGRPLVTYPLPPDLEGSTRRVAVSEDRHTLAVPTQGPLLLYDRETGALRKTVALPGIPRDVWPIGQLLATTLVGRPIVVFVDPASGSVVGEMPLPFSGDIVVTRTGGALLVYAAEHAVLVSVPHGRVVREFTGATRTAAAAAFSPDGRLVAVGGNDHLVGLWDTETGELRDVLRGHAGPVRGLTFSTDGQTLFTGSRDNSVIAWDVEGTNSFARRPSRVPPLPAPIATDPGLTNVTSPIVAWSSDRRTVYTADDTGASALVDVNSGRSQNAFSPYAESLGYSLFSSLSIDIDHAASYFGTSEGGFARLDMRSRSVVTLPPPAPFLYGNADVSGDGQVLAVATIRRDSDERLHTVDITIRDANTLAVRARLPTPDALIWATWLNHDGSLVLTAHNFDNNIEVRDTRTGALRWRTDIGDNLGQAIALSPDGRTLIVGTYHGTVVLIDVTSGRILARHNLRLSAHISSADFSRDGDIIAVGGDDGQVHLLTTSNLNEIGQLPVGAGAAWTNVAHTADGSMLTAVDERGRIVHWDTRPQSWTQRACSIVGRNLTDAEWATFIPGTTRQRTCLTR
jgi:WD40 repeat protein